MSIQKKIVFGLTGPFGSGCSTFASVLREDYGFRSVSLSTILRKKWLEQNPTNDVTHLERSILQSFGDDLRKVNGSDYLAKEANNELRGLDVGSAIDVVFDSIRNLSEVNFLRNTYTDFYLIAVDSDVEDRWNRVSSVYKGNKKLFNQDDMRDKHESGIMYGQQVELCVDNADILIRNDSDEMIRSEVSLKEKIKNRLKMYIDTIKNNDRRPNEEETYMSIAFSASLISTCFKRQVGAVIVEEKTGKIISVGYNENPLPLEGCIEEFGDCFREIYISETMSKINNCPNCGNPVSGLKYPYECTNCKTNIYRFVIPDRAMSRCTALHAEEMALINASDTDLSSSTLYITAFPCFLCAHKIINANIKEICYVDSYPDNDSLGLFKHSGGKGKNIILSRFEGVKARAYFKIFPQWRPQEEKRLELRRNPPPKN